MRYPKFRRQHLFVGSGVIEAGCKSVIGSRLKLALRCSHLNGRFETSTGRSAGLPNRHFYVAHPAECGCPNPNTVHLTILIRTETSMRRVRCRFRGRKL